jgi:hypothetical protein
MLNFRMNRMQVRYGSKAVVPLSEMNVSITLASRHSDQVPTAPYYALIFRWSMALARCKLENRRGRNEAQKFSAH